MKLTKPQFQQLVGAIALIFATIFMIESLQKTKLGATADAAHGIELIAFFNDVTGLQVGAPVRLAGLDIGLVSDINLTQNGQAKINLYIDQTNIGLPIDSSAAVIGDGIFGSKYIRIDAGGEFDILAHGDPIEYTQDSVDFEDILLQIIEKAEQNRAIKHNQT